MIQTRRTRKAVALAAAFLLLARRPQARPHTVVMAWEAFPLSFDPRTGNDQASERLLALTHQGCSEGTRT